MEKIIITIARQYGSGGAVLWEKCWQNACRSHTMTGKSSQWPPKTAASMPPCSRMKKKVHSLRALLTGGYHSNKLLSRKAPASQKDDNLFTYQAKIIRQLAEEGSCVLIGRCADSCPEGNARCCPRVCPCPGRLLSP